MAPALDSRFRRSAVPIFAFLVGLVLAAPALAVPLTVDHSDLATCDPLAVPVNVDELGSANFPLDEYIVATDTLITTPACPSTDTSLINALVTINNRTSFDFVDVWYVADPETSLTNVDGTVNGEEAFKIDAVGLNTPLIFEGGLHDGVFSSGEIWQFIIDDYFNTLGLAASLLHSCAGGPPCTFGLVGNLSVGDVVSSGSIIAFIPEPSTALLFACGLAALALRRRLSA